MAVQETWPVLKEPFWNYASKACWRAVEGGYLYIALVIDNLLLIVVPDAVFLNYYRAKGVQRPNVSTTRGMKAMHLGNGKFGQNDNFSQNGKFGQNSKMHLSL